MSDDLSAAEAAARLGVKRATLYAYVSRGLLHPRRGADGRTSYFDREEVEDFRARRRRSTEGELDTVVSSAITRVRDGDLRVRGHDLVALAAADRDYEDVVDVLWDVGPGSWSVPAPTAKAAERAQAGLPAQATSLDRLRVATAVVSALDPLRFDRSPKAVAAAGRGLLTTMVAALPLRAKEAARTRLADRLWARLSPRRGTSAQRAALNAALSLLVDHGLAASTLGARIAASVRADPYSIVSAGLGIIGGPLHGAASAAVHRMLDDADRTGDPAVAVGEAHRQWGLPPGHGHKVYRTCDPRETELARQVRAAWSRDPRLRTVEAVRDLIRSRSDALPNSDLALGALTWLARMEPDAGEAIFAVARTAGWLAHGLEEMGEPPLRFRPRARYVGPDSADL